MAAVIANFAEAVLHFDPAYPVSVDIVSSTQAANTVR
jgi:hypothetical protein